MSEPRRRFRWLVADLLWHLFTPLSWLVGLLERGRYEDLDALLQRAYQKCPHYQRCSRCKKWGCAAPVMGNTDCHGRPLCEACAAKSWRSRGLAV